MTVFLFADNATSTLAANIGPSAVSITLAPGDGVKFPAPSAGQQFTLTLNDAATHLAFETCYCTARSGDVLTVVRGREGTTALSWVIGDLAFNGPTSGTMAALLQTVHMTDASLSPVFATETVNGNLSVGGNAGVSGTMTSGAVATGTATATTVNATTINASGAVHGANVTASAAVSGQSVSSTTTVAAGSSVSAGNTVSAGTTVTAGTGVFATTGNIQASSGKLRAFTGAYGTGDSEVAVLLGDFSHCLLSASGYQFLPNGLLLQWGSQNVPSGGTPQAYNYPTAFTNQIFVHVAAYGFITPTQACGGQAISLTQYQLTNNAPGGGSDGIWWIAIGL